MEALISHIQRFSLNDGAGLRTTVFFKGCNMKCAWCHNPETLSAGCSLFLYKTKCIGCMHCVSACPKKALSLNENGILIDRKNCVLCVTCCGVCYPKALVLCGTKMTVDKIISEIMQDEAYYKASGGGVTLSGGEALCQKDFVNELLDVCNEKGINTVLETNLNHPFDSIYAILKKFTHIFADIKIFDDARHIQWTGVSNKLIIENLKKLTALNVPVTVRTPLIPEITDTQKNLDDIFAFISGMPGIRKWELLNFNPLGAGKYDNLSMANQFRETKPYSAESLNSLCAKYGNSGLAVITG